MPHAEFPIWQAAEARRRAVSGEEAGREFGSLFNFQPKPCCKTSLFSACPPFLCPSFLCQTVFGFRTLKTGSAGKLSRHFVCKAATVWMGTGQAPCQ